MRHWAWISYCVLALGFAGTIDVQAADVKRDVMPINVQFDQLAKQYVDEFPALSPVSATTLGDHRYDHLVDEVSDEGRSRERAFHNRYLDGLEKIDPQQLSREQLVDYRLLKSHLQAQVWRLNELQEWAWNPIEYTQMTGGAIYGLMAREFAPIEQRLINVAARLEQYPRLFAQIRKTLDPKRVPRVHAETAIKQNRGVLNIIENTVRSQDVEAERGRSTEAFASHCGC